MITKETARQIYNAWQQLEAIDETEADMKKEIERIRKEAEKELTKPIPESQWYGSYGSGMQLGLPTSGCASMRIFNISPEIGIKIMDEQRAALQERLMKLEGIARLELNTSDL